MRLRYEQRLRRTDADKSTNCWDAFWSGAQVYQPLDRLSKRVLDILRPQIADWRKVHVLEAGSGSGKISFELAKLGAEITLLDSSKMALRVALRSERGTTASFVRGDLLSLPFPDFSFDVTWNAGVLEHFRSEELSRAISEMARVTRRGGYVAAFTPFRESVPYRIGKRFQELRGDWVYGYEEPVRSLASIFECHGLSGTEEQDFGIAESLGFVHAIPRALLEITYRTEPILHLLGARGYLLASIGKKL